MEFNLIDIVSGGIVGLIFSLLYERLFRYRVVADYHCEYIENNLIYEYFILELKNGIGHEKYQRRPVFPKNSAENYLSDICRDEFLKMKAYGLTRRAIN